MILSQALIQDFARVYDTATAEQAKPLVDEMMAIQRAELTVKETFLPKFRKVLPEVKVARFLQIENKFDAIISYDSWIMSANVIMNLMEGPLTPFVGAGIGYTWIDTNIPNGLPQTGCWWDPWYGYICSTYYPTKNTDAFSYQAMLGLRYSFNPSTFLRLTYTSQWLQLDNADGSPHFDVAGLEIGWMF